VDLKEDTLETKNTKQWWKSKTILSALVAALIGIYNTVDVQLGPAFGFDLPQIPDAIFTILAAVGIYGRVSADKGIK
jgi:hypothetical protein